MARPPVTPANISPHGAYDEVRSDASEGACGISGYPCVHPGVDLMVPKGTPVAAPHDGWVMVSKATNKPPFTGYGPAVVLLAHDDSPDSASTDIWRTSGGLRSGAKREAFHYSLLAHLDPHTLTYDQDMIDAEGDQSNYVVYDVPHTSQGSNGWIATKSLTSKLPHYAKEGEVLGYIGDAGHVHWEIRTMPFGTHSVNDATVNPSDWLAAYPGNKLTDWSVTTLDVDASKNPDPPSSSSSSGRGWLFALGAAGALWLLSKRRPRRRRGRR